MSVLIIIEMRDYCKNIASYVRHVHIIDTDYFSDRVAEGEQNVAKVISSRAFV